ncbi:unnamed protein product [Colias eurytheme]|nr:unnamed protein product [Colias eurytheme]
MNLCQDLLNKGHCLYTDNWYTSVSLARELMKNETIEHLIGTLRKNSKHFPKVIVSTKLKKGQFIAKKCDDAITVLRWKDKRDVLVLSTKHSTRFLPINKHNKTTMKPAIVLDYNKAKGAVDLSDQMAAYQTTLRKSLKWYRKLVFDLILNIAMVNALVLYRVFESHHVPHVEEQILAAFEVDPTTSLRTVARNLNVSVRKVWITMRRENMYPFHGRGAQGLEENDHIRRVQFCRFLLNGDIDDARFLKSILWTDESKFSREGITNFNNFHKWAPKDNNPKWKKQVSFQRKFSVNMWAGVIGRSLIGPHFLPDNLNGKNYLEFLQFDLPALLYDAEVPILDTDREIIFQQD